MKPRLFLFIASLTLILTGTIIVILDVTRERYPLHVAVYENDYERVVELIEAGVNVNEQADHSLRSRWSPAAKWPPVNRRLVGIWWVPNSTPLHVLVWQDGIRRNRDKPKRGREMATVILNAGAEVELKDDMDFTPLMLAAYVGETDCLELFLEHGADVNAANDASVSALQFAVLQGQLGSIEALLENGVDINARDQFEKTALHCLITCEEEDAEAILRLLIKCGADIGVTSYIGRTLMHEFSEEGMQSCVEVLLKEGADPGLKDREGMTARDVALEHGHLEVATLLQQHLDEQGE